MSEPFSLPLPLASVFFFFFFLGCVSVCIASPFLAGPLSLLCLYSVETCSVPLRSSPLEVTPPAHTYPQDPRSGVEGSSSRSLNRAVFKPRTLVVSLSLLLLCYNSKLFALTFLLVFRFFLLVAIGKLEGQVDR
jgi:hypothetical protein